MTRGPVSRRSPRLAALAALAALALMIFGSLTARAALAQSPDATARDRARLAWLTGDTTQLLVSRPAPLGHFGVRARMPGGPDSLVVVGPFTRLTWNSAIPYSINDGAMWAGRGINVSVTGGAGVTYGVRGSTVRVVVAPTVLYSENLPFPLLATDPRPLFANPFHDNPAVSLDLPHRFGDRYILRLDPGLSSLTVDWPRVSVGVTAANEWWGPGIRNGLVMSSNAPGIPRAFVRTARPIRTRLGAIDAELFAGTLTQSLFILSDTTNRSISGVQVTFRPSFDSTLVLGVERVVYAPIRRDQSITGRTLRHSLDALLHWENLEGVWLQQSDQIGGVFAQWLVPQARLEVYGEFARMALPRTIGELLTAAHYTGAWTFGMQWAQPRRRGSWLRVQSELTYLEQSRVLPGRVTPDFYTAMASPQGYTQRGQIIGAAIGPGASSEWLGIDWMARRWQAGAFVGRIRWDNDALYRRAATFFDHDVSMLSGVRGGWRAPLADFGAEVTWARRYNYLFQNGKVRPGGYRTVDIENLTVSLTATPR